VKNEPLIKVFDSWFVFFVVNVGLMCVGLSSSWLEGKAKTPAGKAEGVRPLRCQAICVSSCIPFVRI